MNNSPKLLTLKISLPGMSYTLANTGRTAGITSALDSAATTTDVRAGNATVTFNKGQVLRITKARLIPSGANGLQPGVGLNAANLKIVQGIASGSDLIKTADSVDVPLTFLNYDQWEDKDFRIEFLADCSSIGSGSGSEVNVDDFDVQDDYVGTAIAYVIEAEAELYIGL